jgi:hypothetical protein
MHNIYTLINSISQTYIDNLSSLKTITKKVRLSSEEFYQKYKTLKKDFLKKRRELKGKTAEYEDNRKINLLDDQVINNEIKDLRLETKLFKEKAKIEISEDKQDINDIGEILDSLVQEVNIFDGLENDDAIKVSEALNVLLREKTNYESDFITVDNDNYNDNDINQKYNENKTDLNDNSIDLLVEKMRISVNELYEKKKISLIDIKYLNNKIFSFGNKCVILNSKDDKIYGI